MGSAYVYSILAVLFITVHCSMASRSNIHEKMTRAERLTVFGSEDSVPEYEVFSASLPAARRRREAHDNIVLKLEIDGKRIVLNLKPTTRYLATKNTPVWSAQYNTHAYENIRYDPLPTAMSKIGEFKMYHDVKNVAAVTVYEDPVEGSVMEGIVTEYYAIKSLPKRLMRELLAEGPYLVTKQKEYKRSIISDTEKDEGYYVVLKIPTASKDVKRNTLDNLRREKRASNTAGKRKIPKAVYPEILIILDYTAMSSSGNYLTQVLRFTLAFWNGVDLFYRALDKPKVYLNIAGIIIAQTKSSTPYIDEDVSISMVEVYHVLSEMGKYFYKERVRFPMNRYDIIIAMSTLKLGYPIEAGAYAIIDGFNADGSYPCSSTREASKTEMIGDTGIIRYTWQYIGVEPAARITGHLLGASHDMMLSNNDSLERLLRSNRSVCLRNKPLWRKQVGKVLPGTWLTLDGQCQNIGYAKACKLKKLSTCAAKGCQAKGSGKCVRTKRAPLPGSKCGTNMHCSTKKKCVGRKKNHSA